MADKKIDRRVSRTRRLLRDALMGLILEKGYDAVTIEEITERADLGRTTFYLHYRDKEELLLESMDAIASDLIDQIARINPALWNPKHESGMGQNDPQIPIRLIFEHAAENADRYRVILRGEGALKASNRLRDIISETAQMYINARLDLSIPENQPRIPIDVVTNYFASSLLGMITWWLEREMPYSPQEMTRMFRQMFFDGVSGMAVF